MYEPAMTEKGFLQWEDEAFGYGYGTGEAPIIVAIRLFFSLYFEEPTDLRPNHFYRHEKLSEGLGECTAWLLINALCRSDILEYGCSPRNTWLTPKGESLRSFVVGHTDQELYDMIFESDVF